MENYLRSQPIPIPPQPQQIRWRWFALGCSCLLSGWVCLSFLVLSGGASGQASEGAIAASQSDTVTAAGTTQRR